MGKLSNMLLARLIAAVMIGAVLALLTACGADDGNTAGESDDIQTEMVRNGLYAGIYEEPVRLDNGEFEGKPFDEGGVTRPRVVLPLGGVRIGDLDNQPGRDAAALLEENSGGSGHFLYLAILSMRDGTPTNIATHLIGDRIDVRKFATDSQQIIIDVVEHSETDAACCPTQLATYRFALEGDSLRTIEHRVTGTMSLAILGGKKWRLVAFDLKEPLRDTVGITLTIDSDRVSGSTGCNAYFAPIKEVPPPGNIEVGEVGSTRKYCPPPADQYEQRFLDCLASARSYSFFMGRLAIFWHEDESMGTMLFQAVADSTHPDTATQN